MELTHTAANPTAGRTQQERKDERLVDGGAKAALGFEAAYDSYGPMVYRLAMVYLGIRADS